MNATAFSPVLVRVMVTATAVFAGAFVSRWLSPGESLSLIWLPAGIAFATAWKYGFRMLWGTALGLLAWGLVSYGLRPLLLIGIVATEVISVVVTAFALRVLLHRFSAFSSDPTGQTTRLRWLICFYVAVAVAGAPVAAASGAVFLTASGVHADLGVMKLGLAYWILEALAVMLIAPALLAWLGSGRGDANLIPFARTVRSPPARNLKIDQGVLLLVALLVAGVLALRMLGQSALEGALALGYILAMAFSAMRHGARTTYTTLVVSALLLSTALSLDTETLSTGERVARAVPASVFATVALIFVTTVLTQVLQAVSSDRSEAFRRLREQSTHDATTGLLNEFGFDEWLAQVSRHETLLVVSAFFGRRARIDALTRQIPLNDLRSAIGAHLRGLGAVAAVRLEGEHYALVFRDSAASRELGEQVAQSLRGMRVIDASGQRIMLHPSLAALRLGPGTRPTCAQLVASLTTMEVPTTDPRSRHLVVHEFSSEIEKALKARAEHLAEVERWVRRGRIVLHCQPIIAAGRAADGRLSIEVLCRMPDTADALLAPTEFLPAIEQLGLSRLFDRRVIETTFAWYARHPEAYRRTRKCAINLTASSIEDASLPEFVADLLTKYDVAAERFCFEITESSAVADSGRATGVIEALRHLGARVAVDDFGTGFATFSYLRKFKVDELKIDGSFIETVAIDPVSEEVVRSTVSVARKLGLVTVAEYVTSELIAEFVTALGVDHLQGNAVAASLSIERAYGLPEVSLSVPGERRRERKEPTA